MALTVLQVKSIKARDKDFKISDGGGLYLHVTVNGAKYWRLAYRFNRKQKILALGVYPQVSLQDARSLASDAKKQIANKIDPSEVRKSNKVNDRSDLENLFQTIATEWFMKQKVAWKEVHASDVLRRLERNIYPHIGHLPISKITSTQVLNAIRIIESRKATDLAKRVLGVCGQVFRFAVASGKCTSDPTRDLKGALAPHMHKHQNAVVPEELPELMRAIDSYDRVGNLQTKLGLEMLAHTFVRTGELINATWDEFDFEKRLWKIPAHRMKKGREHIVPLTSQVIMMLESLKGLSFGGDYVFAGRSSKQPMSNNTLLHALYKLGYKGKMSGHGFRSVASTILNENSFRADVIESQLAHLDGNKVRAAYNRAEYLSERVEMMRWWSDYLDSLLQSGFGKADSLPLAA
jgi:integrase